MAKDMSLEQFFYTVKNKWGTDKSLYKLIEDDGDPTNLTVTMRAIVNKIAYDNVIPRRFSFSDSLVNMLKATTASNSDQDLKLPFPMIFIDDWLLMESQVRTRDTREIVSGVVALTMFHENNDMNRCVAIYPGKEFPKGDEAELLANMILYLNSETPDVDPVKYKERQMARFGVKSISAPVVYVGRKYKSIKGEYDDSGRKLMHRVLVRGHWRMQPYKDDVVKRIFIEPFYKGPKDSAEAIDRIYKVV